MGKQKILDILQDAKAMDQKRSIRNFGRTFEFQGVKEALRPVLPNDKRPQKARKLDTMWMQLTTAKQVSSPSAVPTLEELKARKNVAKISPSTLEEPKSNQKSTGSSVPWTRKGNAQPVNKEVLAAQKEVDDFESCRKTLQDNVKSEAASTNVRKIQTVKKDEILTICESAKEARESVVIESVKAAPEDILCERKAETVEVTNVEIVDRKIVEVSPRESVSPVRIIKSENAPVSSVSTEVKDEGEKRSQGQCVSAQGNIQRKFDTRCGQ